MPSKKRKKPVRKKQAVKRRQKSRIQGYERKKPRKKKRDLGPLGLARAIAMCRDRVDRSYISLGNMIREMKRDMRGRRLATAVRKAGAAYIIADRLEGDFKSIKRHLKQLIPYARV